MESDRVANKNSVHVQIEKTSTPSESESSSFLDQIRHYSRPLPQLLFRSRLLNITARRSFVVSFGVLNLSGMLLKFPEIHHPLATWHWCSFLKVFEYIVFSMISVLFTLNFTFSALASVYYKVAKELVIRR